MGPNLKLLIDLRVRELHLIWAFWYTGMCIWHWKKPPPNVAESRGKKRCDAAQEGSSSWFGWLPGSSEIRQRSLKQPRTCQSPVLCGHWSPYIKMWCSSQGAGGVEKSGGAQCSLCQCAASSLQWRRELAIDCPPFELTPETGKVHWIIQERRVLEHLHKLQVLPA